METTWNFICKGYFHPLDKFVIVMLAGWVTSLFSNLLGTAFASVSVMLALLWFTSPKWKNSWFTRQILHPLGTLTVCSLLFIGFVYLVRSMI